MAGGSRYEDPVPDTRRIRGAPCLKSERPLIRADHRIRRFVTVVLAKPSHAHEVRSVRVEPQLPDVDVVKRLPISRSLVVARLYEHPLAVGRDALGLVVFVGNLAVRRDRAGARSTPITSALLPFSR